MKVWNINLFDNLCITPLQKCSLILGHLHAYLWSELILCGQNNGHGQGMFVFYIQE